MKKLLVCMLAVVGISMFMAGCATTEEAAPATEHPAAADPPMDHPAH